MPNHRKVAGNVLRIYLPTYLYSLLSLGLLCLSVCRSSQNFLFLSGLGNMRLHLLIVQSRFFLGCLFAVVFLTGVNDSFIKSQYALAMLFWQHQKGQANIRFTASASCFSIKHCAVLCVSESTCAHMIE